VPLGVGAHLEKWQVPASQIIELDWWETASVKELTITSTPTRHYSGRGLTDANKTFWSSWSMIGPQHRVYYSGDTGYSDHFQTIGDRFGPFDLSIIKIGAYGPFVSWTDIHMEAEDAIQAHLDVDARRLLPVHWATFNLAFHDWNEPIKRALAAAEAAQIEMVTPRLGEVVTAGEAFNSEKWWVD
jgi:L-ascorbate metabolism protein UlaG (beta-lactamase superfamily)